MRAAASEAWIAAGLPVGIAVLSLALRGLGERRSWGAGSSSHLGGEPGAGGAAAAGRHAGPPVAPPDCGEGAPAATFCSLCQEQQAGSTGREPHAVALCDRLGACLLAREACVDACVDVVPAHPVAPACLLCMPTQRPKGPNSFCLVPLLQECRWVLPRHRLMGCRLNRSR